MKYPKRYAFIITIIVSAVFALSGCGTNNYDGRQYVKDAMARHTSLEAAHVTVTDEEAGVTAQEIYYRFVGDIMQYMYIGHDAATGEEYYEFNNGTELDTRHSGDGKWSFTSKGSDDYYSYSRAKRHYFADGDQLLNDCAAAVSSAEVSEEAGGGHTVRLYYDDSKLALYPSLAGVSAMEQVYSINNTPGQPGYLILHMSYTLDGKRYSYRIETQELDPSAPIERIEPLSGGNADKEPDGQ